MVDSRSCWPIELSELRLEPPQVGRDLHDLVAGLHDLRVQLERPLRGDQVDQLLHRLDVRRLRAPCRTHAGALSPGLPSVGWPEASVCLYRLSPSFSRPSGLRNVVT